MKYVVPLLFSLLFLGIFSTNPFVLDAQLSQSLEITLTPTNPLPGETITARVDSFDIDLTQASISWRYENRIVDSGIGLQTINIVAPKSGVAATLSVTVRGIEGSASALQTIRPGALDVVWESPDTYTPPFYKGKVVPAPGASLRVVAIPFSGAPLNTVFTWKYNNSVVQNQSGNRKNILTLSTNDLTTQNNISVEAEGGTFSAQTSLEIPLEEPSILAYKKNNGFIDYANGFNRSIPLTESGTTIRFEPFGFTRLSSFNSSFISETSIGGELVSQSVFNELPVSRPESSGVANIKTIIQSVGHSFQSQEKQFTLSF